MQLFDHAGCCTFILCELMAVAHTHTVTHPHHTHTHTHTPHTHTHTHTHSLQPNSDVSMINISDDSEQEDEEYQPPQTPKYNNTFPRLRGPGPTHTVAEPTPSTPPTQTRPFNLYVVAEDCAPPKDNEGIMYIRRGQIYDVLDCTSDWWLARLIRDVGTYTHTHTRTHGQGEEQIHKYIIYIYLSSTRDSVTSTIG